jgi:chromosome segregation ATPase
MMKQLPNFLSDSDPVSHLESELGLIDRQMRDHAQRNDEAGLVALRDRKAELPELIQKAKMKDFAERLSVARSRVAAFDIELQTAVQEAGTKGRDAETKIPLLEQEIERLRSEWAQVRHDVESLQFEARQAHAELERIQSERVDLLLAQFN